MAYENVLQKEKALEEEEEEEEEGNEVLMKEEEMLTNPTVLSLPFISEHGEDSTTQLLTPIASKMPPEIPGEIPTDELVEAPLMTVKSHSPSNNVRTQKTPAAATKAEREWSIRGSSPGAKSADVSIQEINFNDSGGSVKAQSRCGEVMRREYLLVVVMGFTYAIIAFGINIFSMLWWELILIIGTTSKTAVLAFFGILVIKLGLICTSIYVTSFRPAAAGSGVPQLRAILSGIWIREYLSLPTLCVKIIAVHFSIASALPTGLEGPFLHISAGLARQLCRFRWFEHLDRKQLLGAGCAGALGAVFGAPIGGVLFSIEVTSTYYPVTNYWTAFCCGISSSTFLKVLNRGIANVSVFKNFISGNTTKFSHEGKEMFKSAELPFFLILGLLLGVIGLGVVKFHAWFVLFRRKHQAKYLGTNPYAIALVIIIFFSTLQFFIGDFALGPPRSAVADLFIHNRLENCQNDSDTSCLYKDWSGGSLVWKLGAMAAVWFFFLSAVQTLAFPAGVVAPAYILGAYVGRFFGEIIRSFLENNGMGTVDARVYAVVGAAAGLGSITKTISPAVIVMEITSEMTLSVPLLLAVIVACGVVSAFGEGFFDCGLRLRGIPMLPIVPTQQYKLVTETITLKDKQEKVSTMNISDPDEKTIERATPKPVEYTVLRLITAADVMEKTTYIAVKPHPMELVEALVESDDEWYPLVHSKSDLVLVGEVRRNVLLDFLKTTAPDIYEQHLPARIRNTHMPNQNKPYSGLSEFEARTAPTSWKKKSKELLSKQKKFLDTIRGTYQSSNDDTKKSDNQNSETLKNDSNNNSKKEIKRHQCSLMAGGFLERLHLAPFQVIAEMPLSKIYTLFHILKPENVYVTKYSRLIGVITELHLLEVEKQLQNNKDAQPLCVPNCRWPNRR